MLGPAEHIQTFTRDAIVAFRSRQWAGSRGGAFLVGNLEHVPDDGALAETFGRFPTSAPNGGFEPAPEFQPQTLVEERDSNQSHLRISYRPQIDPRDREQRAALAVYSTLLGGSMGSRLFDEIREQRGLAYSVYSVDHTFADVPILQLSAGLESGKCVEAYQLHARDRRRPARERAARRRSSSAPAPTPPAGACWRSRTRTRVARHAAGQTVLFGEDIDPDARDRPLDETTLERVSEVARGISVEASVACVGPHDVSEFE